MRSPTTQIILPPEVKIHAFSLSKRLSFAIDKQVAHLFAPHHAEGEKRVACLPTAQHERKFYLIGIEIGDVGALFEAWQRVVEMVDFQMNGRCYFGFVALNLVDRGAGAPLRSDDDFAAIDEQTVARRVECFAADAPKTVENGVGHVAFDLIRF